MGLQDLENDPKFCGELERRKNSSELITILDKAFAGKTRDEWGDLFDKEGNKFLAWERILTISEALVDPQVLENGYVTEFDHPVLGKFKEQPFPLDFSKADTGPRTPAPEFGQHTEEILLDIGYTWEDITQLYEKEVI
jgi:crotonobetainyl-CoA:carnitine CoA-transferase CaiB-like acyl-CoA transferase